MSEEIGLFARDGHLLDLTVERLLVGEIQPAELADHLDGCARCRAAIDAAMATPAPPMPAALRPPPALSVIQGGSASSVLDGDREDAPNIAPPLGRTSTLTPTAPTSGRWRFPAVAGTVLALAAAALLTLTPTDDSPSFDAPIPADRPETFTFKGGGVGLAAFVQHEADDSRRVLSGDKVSPGDRVGFSVEPSRAGYLMVLGDDERNPPYPVWPAKGDAASVAIKPLQLDNAIELDATPGRERFVAVLCGEPFTFEQAGAALEGVSFDDPTQGVMAGCGHEFIILERESL